MKIKTRLLLVIIIVIPIMSIIYLIEFAQKVCIDSFTVPGSSWLFSVGECGPDITTRILPEFAYVIYGIIGLGIVYTIFVIKKQKVQKSNT